MQVHHDEGVANRIDPESCADAREGIGEALTGERIGQPLSRESTLILGADVVPLTEGNTDGRDIASAQTAQRGRRHWHVRTDIRRERQDMPKAYRFTLDAQNCFLNCLLLTEVASAIGFPQRRNRDGNSRKFNVGVFTQPGSIASV